MADSQTYHEQLVLTVLREIDSISLEHLVARLPELTWNQVFQAIDALSRRGAILLQRRGFEYEVKARPHTACLCS
jgi:hypothetical protein